MGLSCAGQSIATIKENVPSTAESRDKAIANFQGLQFAIAPPPDAPDVTDQTVRARQSSQTLSLLAGRGRRQAFFGGGGGTGQLSSGSMLGGY